MLLISSLTSMLRATPFHRDNYSQLIVSVIHQFYHRCLERFKGQFRLDVAVIARSEFGSCSSRSNSPRSRFSRDARRRVS